MHIDYNKTAIVELIKSISRFIWFAFLGLLASAMTMAITSGAISNIVLNLNGFTIDLSSIIVLVVGFAIKAVDKYIHENDNIKSNGLAPEFLQS